MIVADIGDQAERSLEVFFDWLPNLVGALLILIVGWIVARVIAGLVRKALERAGLDRMLHSTTGGEWIRRVVQRPSQLLGTIAFWAIFLGAISLAVSVLGIDALTNLVAAMRPRGVSPSRREASPATPAAIALATKKMSTAARTFGR